MTNFISQKWPFLDFRPRIFEFSACIPSSWHFAYQKCPLLSFRRTLQKNRMHFLVFSGNLWLFSLGIFGSAGIVDGQEKRKGDTPCTIFWRMNEMTQFRRMNEATIRNTILRNHPYTLSTLLRMPTGIRIPRASVYSEPSAASSAGRESSAKIK